MSEDETKNTLVAGTHELDVCLLVGRGVTTAPPREINNTLNCEPVPLEKIDRKPWIGGLGTARPTGVY